MTDDDGRRLRLARARDYPYEIPRRSFVYRDGGPGVFDARLTRGRTPVLAIGSNQSPQRLAQKFGHDASHVIPVQRARLPDFDVVYSAHVASYGAVPAMLQGCRGARVAVAVTWLDDAQLEIMHRSEIAAANYSFAALDDVQVELDDGREEHRAYAYVSSRGHLQHEGEPVALAAIECERRRYPTMTTAQVLEQVRMALEPQMAGDDFVHRLADDPQFRRTVTDRLERTAVAFRHPLRVLRSA
jgi:hypothetical protein